MATTPSWLALEPAPIAIPGPSPAGFVAGLAHTGLAHTEIIAQRVDSCNTCLDCTTKFLLIHTHLYAYFYAFICFYCTEK